MWVRALVLHMRSIGDRGARAAGAECGGQARRAGQGHWQPVPAAAQGPAGGAPRGAGHAAQLQGRAQHLPCIHVSLPSAGCIPTLHKCSGAAWPARKCSLCLGQYRLNVSSEVSDWLSLRSAGCTHTLLPHNSIQRLSGLLD